MQKLSRDSEGYELITGINFDIDKKVNYQKFIKQYLREIFKESEHPQLYQTKRKKFIEQLIKYNSWLEKESLLLHKFETLIQIDIFDSFFGLKDILERKVHGAASHKMTIRKEKLLIRVLNYIKAIENNNKFIDREDDKHEDLPMFTYDEYKKDPMYQNAIKFNNEGRENPVGTSTFMTDYKFKFVLEYLVFMRYYTNNSLLLIIDKEQLNRIISSNSNLIKNSKKIESVYTIDLTQAVEGLIATKIIKQIRDLRKEGGKTTSSIDTKQNTSKTRAHNNYVNIGDKITFYKDSYDLYIGGEVFNANTISKRQGEFIEYCEKEKYDKKGSFYISLRIIYVILEIGHTPSSNKIIYDFGTDEFIKKFEEITKRLNKNGFSKKILKPNVKINSSHTLTNLRMFIKTRIQKDSFSLNKESLIIKKS